MKYTIKLCKEVSANCYDTISIYSTTNLNMFVMARHDLVFTFDKLRLFKGLNIEYKDNEEVTRIYIGKDR